MAMLHEELAETARDLVRYVQERRVGEGGAIGMYAEPLIGLLERAAAESASLRAQVQALQQERDQLRIMRDHATAFRLGALQRAETAEARVRALEQEQVELKVRGDLFSEQAASANERAADLGQENAALRDNNEAVKAMFDERAVRAEAAAAEIAHLRLLPDEWRARAKAQRALAESEDACNPTALLAMADANDDRADDLAAALTSAPEGGK